MASIKVNVTLSPELLERMDEYAKNNALTRSSLIALSVSQYLNSVESMPQVTQLLAGISAVVDGSIRGNMSPEESEAQLRSIQDAYKSQLDKFNR